MVDEKATLEVPSNVCMRVFGKMAPGKEEELTIFLSFFQKNSLR